MKLVALLNSVLAVDVAAAAAAAEASGKNVLYIVTDDLRPDLGCFDLPRVTPGLDRLASQGVLFDRAYAQQALCGPSRNSFMSGRRPDATKSYNQRNNFRQVGPHWTSLPGLFKDNGYLTLGTGKLYHPCPFDGKLRNQSHMLDCGGPHHYDGEQSWSKESLPYENPCYHFGIQCFPCPKRPSPIDPGWAAKLGALGAGEQSELEQWCELEALDDRFTEDKAFSLLRAAAAHAAPHHGILPSTRRRSPFFLGVGFHKPHIPWQAQKKYFDRYPLDKIEMPKHMHAPKNVPPVAFMELDGTTLNQSGGVDHGVSLDIDVVKSARRAYYASVAEMDDRVGRLLDEVDRLGLTNDTLVVFHADHGWSLGEQNEWEKFTNFENSVRVPLIVRAPWLGAAARGSRRHHVVELVDVMPTLADLAGVPLPAEDLPGRSLRPLLEDPAAPFAQQAISQFPRYWSDKEPNHNHNIDHIAREKYTHMGYSLRSAGWRYTEWRAWQGEALQAVWTGPPYARELYDHRNNTAASDFDNFENVNVAEDPANVAVVAELSDLLHSLAAPKTTVVV